MVPFRVSDDSVKQFKALIERTPQAKPQSCVRIFISGLSHCGPEWGLTLDEFSPEIDECCEIDGLRVIVERGLLEAVGGIEVEFESDGEEDGGFVITPLDPDVQSFAAGCGCGCGGCGGCGGGCHSEGGCAGCHSEGSCGGCGGCGSAENGEF